MSIKIYQIHDKYFRETLSHKQVAQDFPENYLPQEISKYLDLETLAICKDTFVDVHKAGHYSDLLYEVQATSGQAYIYLLFEHKSTADPFIALQMLRYMLEIWELYRKQHPKKSTLPLIIPIVLYHGRFAKQAQGIGQLVDLPGPDLKVYVPDFTLAFLDFSPEADTKIKGEVLTQLFLHCLRAKNEPKAVEHLLNIILLIAELDDSAPSLQWIQTIFAYINQVMDIDKDVVRNLSKLHLAGSKEDIIMTIAEQWKMEGRQEGRNAILSRLLAKRFGQDVVNLQVQKRLQNASEEELDLWAERILDAQSIEDVFGPN